MPRNDPDHPVLIVAPMGNDAAAIADALQAQDIAVCICDDLAECTVVMTSSTAALIVTEEALEQAHVAGLLRVLEQQPKWSELPLIILASNSSESRWNTLLEVTSAAPGAVTLLERPLQTDTLLQTVKVALRSRRRQYQVRDLLEDQQRSVQERENRAAALEDALTQRTEEVIHAQQRLATTQRMAAVGTLASGLAHDMGNILLPLSGRLETVLSDARLTGEHRADLNVVVALIDHLRQMSKNLSLFARDPDQEGVQGATHLARWAQAVRGLIETSTGGRRDTLIRFKWDIGDDLPPINIAPHRFTQIILNLVHNARDAILLKHQAQQHQAHLSGVISVEARGGEAGSWVTISVSDNGIGMSEETVRRCIEPFYTTKDRPTMASAAPSISSGSGMGLTLVHGIAQKAGGDLRIHSRIDEGTTVELVLPVVAVAKASTAAVA